MQTLKSAMPKILVAAKTLNVRAMARLTLHLASEQPGDRPVPLTEDFELFSCRGRRIVVKPEGCAPFATFVVETPDATSPPTRFGWGDTLSTVVRRFYPVGNFTIRLDGEATSLDPELTVGGIGLCDNDRLIVTAPKIRFVFAYAGEEREVEVRPDWDVGTAAGRTGLPLPDQRVYLYDDHFVDASTAVGSLPGTGRIEIFDFSQQASFRSSTGLAWPLALNTTSTCADAIRLLQGRKASGLAGTRIRLYLDEARENEIAEDAVLFLISGSRTGRLEFYCRVWREYRFQICYRGEESERTESFTDDATVGSCRAFFESEFGCEVKLTCADSEMEMDGLLFDLPEDVVRLDKL
jgi:hypothetical protein